MRIYLDVCALNRPFDDQAQERIHLESEAVLAIFDRFAHESGYSMVGSEAVDYEISRIPDPLKRQQVRFLSQFAEIRIPFTDEIIFRARQLQKSGFAGLDSLHLACAEEGAVQALLTTDDKLIQKALRNRKKLKVAVENPLKWLMEKMK